MALVLTLGIYRHMTTSDTTKACYVRHVTTRSSWRSQWEEIYVSVYFHDELQQLMKNVNFFAQ